MVNKEFRSLFNSLSSEEIIELSLMDPDFLSTFCYMLTLEIQSNKENLIS
jgi:hypothetical protein